MPIVFVLGLMIIGPAVLVSSICSIVEAGESEPGAWSLGQALGALTIVVLVFVAVTSSVLYFGFTRPLIQRFDRMEHSTAHGCL